MMNKEWKEFKYNEIFKIERGKGPRINSVIKGETPFITATESNNGLTEYVEYPAIHKGNCITVNRNGTIGEAFYQVKDFCSTEDVHIFYPKGFELTKERAFFLITLIKKEKYRFGYGRKWGIERMKNSIIKLPVNSIGSPDWEYMSEYINELWRKRIPSLKNIKKIKSNKKISFRPIDEWKEFKLIDYFDMKSGQYYSKDSFSSGEVPLISTTDNNNGIMSYTDLEAKFEGNVLTIGKIGVTTFYQKKPFVATSDVTVLIPKFESFDAFNALFLVTIIKQERNKWSYGRQIRLGDCKELVIKLPVDSVGHPDWKYMSEYIKSLNYSEKIGEK